MLALLISTVPTDPPPDDNKVVAGWLAFWIFVALIAAVAFLCWNFTKQLRKTQKAKEQGVFGDEPEVADDVEAETHDAER
jgi:membrane protein implicated in regulation of membrane protease activity